MKKSHRTSAVAIAAILLVLGIALLFVKSQIDDILAGVFFGLCFAVLMRSGTSKKSKNITQVHQSRNVNERLLNKTEADVADKIDAAQTSPLGSEYRKKHRHETELIVEEMLDTFIKVISAKLQCYTTAVFFKISKDHYAMKRGISKTDALDKNAQIIPRRGILGSLLTEDGIRQFYERNFTNKNSTLYYYDENYDFKPEESIRSIMLHPITVAGETRGIVLVDSTKDNAYSNDDQCFLENVAKLIGKTIYYTYLNTEHSLDYRRLAAISDIEKDFWNDLEFDKVMDKMCSIISDAIPCDRLTISLKEENKMTASVLRVRGENSEGFHKLKFNLDGDNSKSIASLAYSNDFGFFRNFNDDRHEYRYTDNEPKSKGFGSFVVMPFGVDKNKKGLMFIESVMKDAFTPFSLDLLSRLGTSAGLALEKIFIIQKAHNLAFHDELTGLHNRRHFEKILETKIAACARYNDTLSFVICDIDHFKKFNDNHGHLFGDTVLQYVATKLAEGIRGDDIDAVARWGGEEFVMMFYKMDAQSAWNSVERVRKSIENMIICKEDGTKVNVTMSFGIASYPHDGTEGRALKKKADDALYIAKDAGRNKSVVYGTANG